ncbi:hypothetical protein J437_LFUL004530 [Ladona fulva]|uniref:Uncharacterized protein n=1 Tax=Ladona fulva TaxID=123851 RepID=A0A8K0KA34_LADFU|nr:hypothetical protein J437_LFUL004530 [Ladona fulva]
MLMLILAVIVFTSFIIMTATPERRKKPEIQQASSNERIFDLEINRSGEMELNTTNNLQNVHKTISKVQDNCSEIHNLYKKIIQDLKGELNRTEDECRRLNEQLLLISQYKQHLRGTEIL